MLQDLVRSEEVVVGLFVVVGIVDAFHEHFTAIDVRSQGAGYELLDGVAVGDAEFHSVEIVVLVYPTPVDTLLEAGFEHEVEPDAGAAPVAFHERVYDVHFHIFVENLVE